MDIQRPGSTAIFYCYQTCARFTPSTDAYSTTIISWKTTTKFMKTPGSLGYIFAKSRSNEIVGSSYFLRGTSCERLDFSTTIDKV